MATASINGTNEDILEPNPSVINSSDNNDEDCNKKKKKKKSKEKKTELCEICSESSQVPVSYCVECKQKMCYRCISGHNRIKLCQDHAVLWFDLGDVAEKAFGYKPTYRSKNEQNSAKEPKNNEEICETGRKSKIQERYDYQKMIDGVFEMKDFAKQLSIKNEDQCVNRIENLWVDMLKVAKTMDEVGENPTEILGPLAIKVARQKIHEVTDELFVYQDNPGIDLENSIPVEQDGLSAEEEEKKRKQRRKILRTLCQKKSMGTFLRLTGYYYSSLKTLMLHDTARRLKMIDGKLWLSMWKSMRVCTLDSVTVREVRYCGTDEVCGVIPGEENNELIVAYYDKGLCILDEKGLHKTKIINGNFSDIVRFKGKIYALEYQNNCIQVFEYIDGSHSKCDSISLTYDDISCGDTMFLTEDKIYLCSSLNHCLYIYSYKGKQEAHRGHFGHYEDTSHPGSLHYPRLCAVDKNGYAVVADCWNKRLQVCTNTGEWKLVKLLGDSGEIWDVVIGENIHTMYGIAEINNGYKMLQFSTDLM